MTRVVRLALLALIALLLVSVVIGFATAETGPAEKTALAVIAALLLLAVAQVRRRLA